MTADEAEALIADGVITGGMVPKVRAALPGRGLARRGGGHLRLPRLRTR